MFISTKNPTNPGKPGVGVKEKSKIPIVRNVVTGVVKISVKTHYVLVFYINLFFYRFNHHI